LTNYTISSASGANNQSKHTDTTVFTYICATILWRRYQGAKTPSKSTFEGCLHKLHVTTECSKKVSCTAGCNLVNYGPIYSNSTVSKLTKFPERCILLVNC